MLFSRLLLRIVSCQRQRQVPVRPAPEADEQPGMENQPGQRDDGDDEVVHG